MRLRDASSRACSQVNIVVSTSSAEDEVEAGRPMLSSVTIAVKGKPGPGFFRLASQLGRFSAGDDEAEFWEQERAGTYDAWKRPLPKVSRLLRMRSRGHDLDPRADTPACGPRFLLISGLLEASQRALSRRFFATQRAAHAPRGPPSSNEAATLM